MMTSSRLFSEIISWPKEVSCTPRGGVLSRPWLRRAPASGEAATALGAPMTTAGRATTTSPEPPRRGVTATCAERNGAVVEGAGRAPGDGSGGRWPRGRTGVADCDRAEAGSGGRGDADEAAPLGADRGSTGVALVEGLRG